MNFATFYYEHDNGENGVIRYMTQWGANYGYVGLETWFLTSGLEVRFRRDGSVLQFRNTVA